MFYKLNPILTYNLWGGEKLSKLYNQETDQYGEAWILSCLNGKNSPIGRGYFYKKSYMTLKDLFDANPNIVRKGYKGKFPLLIKLIDAQQDLSIQVHPKVKTEFWHVLNRRPSHLYMGFNSKTNRKEVSDILRYGDITQSLNHIEVNEGASYLGECALIPFDSPINNTNILFLSTLYDENASCHLALGRGFNNCLRDFDKMTNDECKELGINDSMIHVDFMIGSKDMDIVGIDKNGNKVQIFKNGNWAF